MKVVKFLLKLGTNLGFGGVWKHLANVVVYVVVLGALYMGFNAAWNKSTYANKHYKELLKDRENYRKLYDDASFQNNALLVDIIHLKKDSIKKEERIKSDSLNFNKRVVEFQSLIKVITQREKEQKEHINNLESNLWCKRVNIFGKTTAVEPCDK